MDPGERNIKIVYNLYYSDVVSQGGGSLNIFM